MMRVHPAHAVWVGGNATNPTCRDGLWQVLAKQAHENPSATVIGSGPRPKSSSAGHSSGHRVSVRNWQVTQFRSVIQEFFGEVPGKNCLFLGRRKRDLLFLSRSCSIYLGGLELRHPCLLTQHGYTHGGRAETSHGKGAKTSITLCLKLS